MAAPCPHAQVAAPASRRDRSRADHRSCQPTNARQTRGAGSRRRALDRSWRISRIAPANAATEIGRPPSLPVPSRSTAGAALRMPAIAPAADVQQLDSPTAAALEQRLISRAIVDHPGGRGHPQRVFKAHSGSARLQSHIRAPDPCHSERTRQEITAVRSRTWGQGWVSRTQTRQC